MKTITTIVMSCLLIGSSVVYAGQGPAAASADAATTAPQLMQQNMYGRPDSAGDGINNAFQVDEPTDIGRSGLGASDAPDPILLEGGAGAQEAK